MKFSIITPSFRNSAWLKLCIASVADQTGVDALVREASRRGIPLTVLTHPALHDLYQARFTLIRPDQHVAWRGDTVPESGPLLACITGFA